MITAEQVKEQITDEQIIDLLCNEFGSPYPQYDNQNNLIFNTCVCHGGDSFKLYYYIEAKTFYCYSHCGNIGDIFALVQHVKQYETFQEAFKFVLNYFHIQNEIGFTNEEELTDDWDIFQWLDDFSRSEEKQKQKEEFKILNPNILEYFNPLIAPQEWIQDNISPEVMAYYGIRVDSALHKVIIPHRDINGNLIGIRGRTYNPIELAKGQKYMPVFIEGTMYNHKLGNNLYGIYENKETIKRLRKVLVCESEKSVMQCATYFGVDNCWAVAVCGSSFSYEQLELLLKLGVEEIIFAFDHDVELTKGEDATIEWESKILNQIEKALPYANCYCIADYNNILPLKASPSDCGKEKLIQLMKEKVYIPSPSIQSNKKRKY